MILLIIIIISIATCRYNNFTNVPLYSNINVAPHVRLLYNSSFP